MPPCWVSSGMIKQFSDHAANERTYLAWMRTGIAIIAFGFVLERFDIFLLTITNSLSHSPAENLSHGGREAGVALIVAGLLTIVTAMRRFAATSKMIASGETEVYNPTGPMRLGILVLGLGIFILLYVARFLFASA